MGEWHAAQREPSGMGTWGASISRASQRTGGWRGASGGTSRVTSCLAAHIFTLQLCPSCPPVPLPDFLFSAAFGFVCCLEKPRLSFCYTALPRHAPYMLPRSSTFIANLFSPPAAPHNIWCKATSVDSGNKFQEIFPFSYLTFFFTHLEKVTLNLILTY